MLSLPNNKIESAPLADLQLYGSYARSKPNNEKESWEELCDRVLLSPTMGLFKIAQYTDEQKELVEHHLRDRIAFGSARFLWCGGTPWLEKPENWHGIFNCVTRNVTSIDDMALCMDLSMQGCGVGTVLEPKYIHQLPTIKRKVEVEIVGEIGKNYPTPNADQTVFVAASRPGIYRIWVGDSRQGWVKAYWHLLNVATQPGSSAPIRLTIDLGLVRPAGIKLKGFGGVANPEKLPAMFINVARVLSGAVGRQLDAVECCLVIDEAAAAIVAGGIRRSAGIRQFSSKDDKAAVAKAGLWVEGKDRKWRVDPFREALQMANHTRVYHEKPSRQECLESVEKQWFSGEGAIQWAGETLVRANQDLLNTKVRANTFLNLYPDQEAGQYLAGLYHIETGEIIPREELTDRLARVGLNPCGEKIGNNNHCNLGTVALAKLDPKDFEGQKQAFEAASLMTVPFLHRNFLEEKFARSRNLDPIVLVSFTEAFDFFTRMMGVDWIQWWAEGRPSTSVGQVFKAIEKEYLSTWRDTVHQTVWEYCDENGLRRPNRCTGVKPEGSLTLLTGVGCCGVHPPKAWRYIRRKEFRKNDPVALAAIDYGYSVMPARNDKDENGHMLDDPFDPRVTTWVVEVPVEEPIVRMMPELEEFPPNQFSALAQMDWFMQVQNFYSTHNTSSTVELRKSEIEEVGDRVYELIQANQGYVSMTFLARFDDHQSFPRLPFEPISKQYYDYLMQGVRARRKSNDLHALVNHHLKLHADLGPSDSACDSQGCER